VSYHPKGTIDTLDGLDDEDDFSLDDEQADDWKFYDGDLLMGYMDVIGDG
jgi:hypothetical protein